MKFICLNTPFTTNYFNFNKIVGIKIFRDQEGIPEKGCIEIEDGGLFNILIDELKEMELEYFFNNSNVLITFECEILYV